MPPNAKRKQSFPARLGTAFRRRPLVSLLVLLLVTSAAYLLYLNWLITDRFEGRRWDLPARVYARPLELYAGLLIEPYALEQELLRLGYRRVATTPDNPGTFRREGERIEAVTRRFQYWDALQPPLAIDVRFDRQGITSLREAGREIAIGRLDPLLVGSIFPRHGEDRIVVNPEQVPPLLRDALKAVEDRRFDDHAGVDPVAVGRALLANVRAGAFTQGGSTLTQQLVKNYFLDNRQTLWRKFREALMAVILEMHYSKSDLLNAYINEIYMGQDGNRAIHGFGLASQYYFSRPLDELELPQIALLVALVRGPGYYDPVRFPARARDRRALVLDLMQQAELIPEREASLAASGELGVWDRKTAGASYYPAYLQLVREQLMAQYRQEDLTQAGLRIFTALDPLAQASAERRVAEGLSLLDGHDDDVATGLAGAAVVTSTQSGDVLAVVGDRRSGYEGFNRALDARRPVGSLLKPVVYLAALQSGQYTMASRLLDDPISITLDNGDVWEPRNFNDESLGEVTLLQALAESLNRATVRLGLDVGIGTVAALASRLGDGEPLPPYPSLLLGAVDMTPMQVAGLYSTLANGGFHTPLRAVRSVIDADGAPLERYPIVVAQVADTAAVYQLNEALLQVMKRGTGRSAVLPDGLTVAGKSGTSDEFRDSWFAGFSGDRVAVVWVGHDDNRPMGLSGASGALRIWAPLMADTAAVSYSTPLPEGLESRWVNYYTGAEVRESCPDAVELGLPRGMDLPRDPNCGPRMRDIGKRTLEWLNDVFN
ncbi:MAG: penicillin-binding protein 1B [Woeseia sp.]